MRSSTGCLQPTNQNENKVAIHRPRDKLLMEFVPCCKDIGIIRRFVQARQEARFAESSVSNGSTSERERVNASARRDFATRGSAIIRCSFPLLLSRRDRQRNKHNTVRSTN